MQATNEELETNNEELEATNEELQTTNDELTARTAELQELSKQHVFEQLQLASLLERFPHYVMVLNAKDLTIEEINPGYKQLFGDREVKGLPVTEIFSGRNLDELVRVLRSAAREAQSVHTGPILASVDGDLNPKKERFIHTIVPITDASGANVSRLFIYSERVGSG